MEQGREVYPEQAERVEGSPTLSYEVQRSRSGSIEIVTKALIHLCIGAFCLFAVGTLPEQLEFPLSPCRDLRVMILDKRFVNA